jgi:predicted CoA-binding protein
MAYSNPSDEELRKILTSASTVAIVGASSKPDRTSHGIMERLQFVGYRVVPVNPNETEVLGERAYPSLRDVPIKIDIVDVFRRPEFTPAIADDAVAIGAKVLWLQSGIWNDDAAARAQAGGLKVVMNACLATVHSYLRVPRKS